MSKKFIIVFSLIFLVFSTLSILYFNYNDYINVQELMNNSLISQNSISIYTSKNNIRFSNLADLVKKYNDITVFIELNSHKLTNIFGIYGNIDILQIICPNTNLSLNSVILGVKLHSINEYIKKIDKDEYFYYMDKMYKIIEIISLEKNHMLDNTAYILLDYNNNFIVQNFIIDSKNIDSIKDFITEIKSIYDDVYVFKEDTDFINKNIFNHTNKDYLNITLIIFILVILIVLLVYVFYSFKVELKIKWLIGFSFLDICKAFLSKIILLIICNSVVVFVIYTMIYLKILNNYKLDFYVMELFYLYLFSTLLISIFLFIYTQLQIIFLNKYGVK